MSTGGKRIAIAGAGIGGLAAGLALLKQGFDVDIYEQAAELGEVGAGVQISPNGTRLLQAWGLGDAMFELGTQTRGKEIRVWNTADANRYLELGAASVSKYGAPYLTFHRADLHALLLEAVRREKRDAIHLNAAFASLGTADGGAEMRLASGRTVRADALIGADGVHSKVRQALFGADRPRFTGCMAWRGLIDASRLPASINRTGGVSWLGPTAHVLTYPIRKGRMLNFIGMVDRADWTVESWNARGTIAECLADFEGWHEDVIAMIERIEVPYKWALIVRDTLPVWVRGHVALLGDACHSTLPFMAQGANMALEDAMVLGRCLRRTPDDIPAALASYERMRVERTTRIVNESAAQITRVHAPVLAEAGAAREHIRREWEPHRVEDRYDWVYGYDAIEQPFA